MADTEVMLLFIDHVHSTIVEQVFDKFINRVTNGNDSLSYSFRKTMATKES